MEMLQHIIVGLVFLMAIGYLIRVFRKTIAPKQECGAGCGCEKGSLKKN